MNYPIVQAIGLSIIGMTEQISVNSPFQAHIVEIMTTLKSLVLL